MHIPSRRDFMRLGAAFAGSMLLPDHGQLQTPEGSGYFYPNWLPRDMFDAIEEIMGRNGLNTILQLAGLSQYIGNYPPHNMDKGYDIAQLTALQYAMADIYGPRGGRGLALRCGRALFARTFRQLTDIAVLIFKEDSPDMRLRISLQATANIFALFTDQNANVLEAEDDYTFSLGPWPGDFDLSTDSQAYIWVQGLLQEGARNFSGGLEFEIETCSDTNEDMCCFIIHKEPVG